MPEQIPDVYLWANEMLMVFDRSGQQIPDYQGSAIFCLPRALRDAPSDCRWHIGEWQGYTQDVDRYHMEARAVVLATRQPTPEEAAWEARRQVEEEAT